MEFIMQKNRYLPMTLIAVAILAGCVAPKNSSLTEAHSSYDSASTNPQVTNLAALELKQAGDSLNKADSALSDGESADTVNQLAYIAKQQVAIAQETAKRKTAELAVADASAKRDQVRLEARTAEADAAKQQVAIMQEAASQQAAALAAAGANAERNQTLIAQQEMQLKELNAKKTERGLVITLGDVLFSTNKAQLKSGGMHNVQKLADFLKQYPQRKVLVEGYTDSTGSNSLNQELSDRRADAVRTALIDMGISSDRVTTRGYGKAFPVAGNDTAASRQLNRRVEIILSDENGNIAPR
jgi:outer membrane protein OmpA-like peptidoglycan-associated protein